MEHKGTILIETERLFLRQFVIDDAPAVYRNWTSDNDVTEFLRWQTHKDISETKEVLHKWIDSYNDLDFYQWAITLKGGNNEPIGTISVVGINEILSSVHIGYCIGKKYWNMGITSEALLALIPYFFDDVKANRIESQHDPNNPNSGRVMLKCGLNYEGTLKQADYSNRGIVDACVYALTADDYNNKQ